MNYLCPVCGYRSLPRRAQDDLICPSCGTQFGYTDCSLSHRDLRNEWIGRGAKWHSRHIKAPTGFNGIIQLLDAGFIEVTNVTYGDTESKDVIEPRPIRLATSVTDNTFSL